MITLFSHLFRNRHSLHILLLVAAFLISGISTDVFASENDTPLVYGDLRAKASFTNNSKQFELGNTGDFATGVIRSNIKTDTDKWGEGYEVVIGTSFFDPLTLEASFEQCFMNMSSSQHNLPGVGAGADVSVMPFVNTDFGNTQFGFYLSQNPNVGLNSDGDYSFRHTMDYHCIRLGVSTKIYDSDNFFIDLIGGPVYANLTRRYKVSTKGTNPGVALGSPTSITSSNTSETLKSDFWGGEIGTKAVVRVLDNLSLSSKVTADLFSCNSKFEATQWVSNGFNLDLGTFSSMIQVDDWDTSFVPHFATNADIKYDVTRNISISLFYQIDLWLDMPYISNPKVSADLNSSSGRASIRTGEQLLSQAVGGSLNIRF